MKTVRFTFPNLPIDDISLAVSPDDSAAAVLELVDRIVRTDNPGLRKHQAIFLDPDAETSELAMVKFSPKLTDCEDGGTVDVSCQVMQPLTTSPLKAGKAGATTKWTPINSADLRRRNESARRRVIEADKEEKLETMQALLAAKNAEVARHRAKTKAAQKVADRLRRRRPSAVSTAEPTGERYDDDNMLAGINLLLADKYALQKQKVELARAEVEAGQKAKAYAASYSEFEAAQVTKRSGHEGVGLDEVGLDIEEVAVPKLPEGVSLSDALLARKRSRRKVAASAPSTGAAYTSTAALRAALMTVVEQEGRTAKVDDEDHISVDERAKLEALAADPRAAEEKARQARIERESRHLQQQLKAQQKLGSDASKLNPLLTAPPRAPRRLQRGVPGPIILSRLSFVVGDGTATTDKRPDTPRGDRAHHQGIFSPRSGRYARLRRPSVAKIRAEMAQQEALEAAELEAARAATTYKRPSAL